MTFGTPLSPAAIKVMLLGSGELGKEVVIELQRLGVETIAVDRYAGAPAQQVAHRAHVIDMTDAKALRAVVEQAHRDEPTYCDLPDGRSAGAVRRLTGSTSTARDHRA